MYQPTNVQKLFAAALDDGRSMLEASDLSHWVEAAVSAGGSGRTMALSSSVQTTASPCSRPSLPSQ